MFDKYQTRSLKHAGFRRGSSTLPPEPKPADYYVKLVQSIDESSKLVVVQMEALKSRVTQFEAFLSSLPGKQVEA